MGIKDKLKSKRFRGTFHSNWYCKDANVTIVIEEGEDQTPTTFSTQRMARPTVRPNSCVIENEPLSASERSLEIEAAAHPSPHNGRKNAASFISSHRYKHTLRHSGLLSTHISFSGKLSLDNDLSSKKRFACLPRVKCFNYDWMIEL